MIVNILGIYLMEQEDPQIAHPARAATFTEPMKAEELEKGKVDVFADPNKNNNEV